MLIVLAIVALLLSLSLPRYFQSIDTSKETVLKENLRTIRSTLQKFYGDTGRYPDSLDELVDKKYITALPIDPVTDSAVTWRLVAPTNAEGKVYDVKSGAVGKTRDGLAFEQL